MTMKMVNIAEAKARLSDLLDDVERGETIVIARRNEPVAELRAITKPRKTLRPWGLYKGQIEIPDDFNDPMPEFERLFYGENEE
jgi:antitoxin (DNA-binding transcriptional repressor) of toxin-antitoxin stability system